MVIVPLSSELNRGPCQLLYRFCQNLWSMVAPVRGWRWMMWYLSPSKSLFIFIHGLSNMFFPPWRGFDTWWRHCATSVGCEVQFAQAFVDSRQFCWDSWLQRTTKLFWNPCSQTVVYCQTIHIEACYTEISIVEKDCRNMYHIGFICWNCWCELKLLVIYDLDMILSTGLADKQSKNNDGNKIHWP